MHDRVRGPADDTGECEDDAGEEEEGELMCDISTEKYYSLEEIKKKFINYRNELDFGLDESEFMHLCKTIQFLPKHLVDQVENKIFFIPMTTGNGEKPNIALMKRLKILYDNSIEAIIVLSPMIFGYCSKVDIYNDYMAAHYFTRKILHEIAHYFLGHEEYFNQSHKDQIEKDTDKKVQEWIDAFWEWEDEND